jgi:hypothetical protein
VNVREEALAIHLLLVFFPGVQVVEVTREVRDEVKVLARKRRPPTQGGRE